MRILYFSDYSSVFFSQTVEYLNMLSSLGYKVTLFTSHDWDSNHFDVVRYKKYPEYPIFTKKNVTSIYSALKKIKYTQDTIIHVRTELLYIPVVHAINKISISLVNNILVDIRGAVYHEIKNYSDISHVQIYLKLLYFRMSKRIITNAKHISTVTEELGKYVGYHYGIGPDIISIQSCISGSMFKYDEHIRTETRLRLGYSENDIVIVLQSGSMAKWQNIEETIALFDNVKVKILILGVDSIQTERVTSLRVKYNDVPNYLCAADIGLLIRNYDVVNKVALPVKFCEYLSCGLPVITNGSVIEVRNVINREKVGLVIGDTGISERAIEQLSTLNRFIISKIGNDLYGVEQVTRKYLTTYENMLKDILNSQSSEKSMYE